MAVNQAKQLAKELLWASEGMNDPKIYGMEKEGYRREYQRVTMAIVQSGYSADTVLGYMEEYKNLKLGEHGEWIES